MPVKDGRWISRSQFLAEKQAATPDEPEAEPTVEAEDAPKAKRQRKSRKAAEAAVADATGVDVSLDEPVVPADADEAETAEEDA